MLPLLPVPVLWGHLSDTEHEAGSTTTRHDANNFMQIDQTRRELASRDGTKHDQTAQQPNCRTTGIGDSKGEGKDRAPGLFDEPRSNNG